MRISIGPNKVRPTLVDLFKGHGFLLYDPSGVYIPTAAGPAARIPPACERMSEAHRLALAVFIDAASIVGHKRMLVNSQGVVQPDFFLGRYLKQKP
jgi:hypothetical protein